MVKKNLKFIAVICLISCISTASGITVPVSAETPFTPITESFDSETVGTLPGAYKANFTDGTVSVESYLGNNCIMISKSNDGSISNLTRQFSKIDSIGIEVKFDFLQKSVKSNGTTVGALLSGSNEIVKIETNSGNISYKKNDGTYEVLVPSYMANKWYSFTVTANLATGMVSILVDGNKVLADTAFTKSGSYCNAVSFYTKNSPGIAIDNVGIKTTNKLDKIKIEGNDKATVPISGTNEYEYKATVYDDFDAEIDEALSWTVSPAAPGITLATKAGGKKATLSIANDTVYNGNLTLTATSVNAPSVSKSISIILVDSAISEIKIEGAAKLAYGLKDNNKFKYTYKMYDQYGVEQTNEAVVMKIKEKAPEVMLDATTGTITVLDPITSEKHITLVMYYANDTSIKAEKKLTLMDLETYKNDQARIDILHDAIENIIEYAKDIYKGTPLLASVIDLHTGRSPIYKSMTAGTPTVMSNLAQDSVLYKAFDAAVALSDDEDFNKKITKKVDDIYQWYLDYGIDPYNMGYWGGHTYINLLTSGRFGCEGNENTHELKDTAFYMEPFFRLDPDRAYSLIKTVWGGHLMTEDRWKSLQANRHAYVDSARGPQIAAGTAYWENIDIFDDTETAWLRTTDELPFRAIGDDMVTLAATAYKETGDEKARTWAYRMLQQYYKRRDPNTGIIPSLYATGKNAPGGKDPQADYEGIKDASDPPYYWQNPLSNSATVHGVDLTSPAYGDRFFNQYAEDLVAQGYYGADALSSSDTRLLEGNYFSNSDNFGVPVLHDLQIAKALGEDTPEGKEIRRLQTISLASYIKYAWIKNTDKVRPIMADGTSLMGFKPKRNGFFSDNYSKDVTIWGGNSVDLEVFLAACACFDIAKNDRTLSEQADILWPYIQFFGKYYGLGVLGKNDIGDSGMNLNFAASASSPKLLMAVTDLYYSTGDAAFLTLARRVAENMISTYYRYGIFVNGTNVGVSPGQTIGTIIGAGNALKYYALCYLEAAIRGEKNLIPEYYDFSGYVQGYYEMEATTEQKRTYIDTHIPSAKYGAVEAQDLIIDDVIYVKPGETKKLEYQLLPDDITNKSIVCESEDKNIVRVNKDNMSLIGVRKGVANLVVCSNEFNIIKNVKVIVTEEVPDEENN